VIALSKKNAATSYSCNSLVQGSVIHGRMPGFSSNSPHFFVVLNKNSYVCTELVLIPATSQIGKVMDRLNVTKQHEDTVVIVDHSHFSHFSMQTALDCNWPFIAEKGNIQSLFNSQQMVLIGVLKQDIVARLVNGFITSEKTEAKYQKLVL